MDNRSLSHTKWKCQCHIVFIPKYRKKVLYGKVREDVRKILSTLCKYKNVEIIAGAVCVDHVHLSIAIPPKLSVSDFMGYLEGWENLKKSGFKVDYILTHTAPQNIVSKMGYKDLPGRNEEAPLREFLQQVADHTDFKAWYFGHFHKDCKIADSYFCLYDILSLAQSQLQLFED